MHAQAAISYTWNMNSAKQLPTAHLPSAEKRA